MQDIGLWLAPAGALAIWLAMTRLGKVSRSKAHELVAGGARLIDVRTEAEFASGHVRGATNVPLDRLGRLAAQLASEGKPLVVYCASGVRSAVAKRALRRAGAEVYDLGAMSRW
jgi:rhodanese-related sulfurtransferase